MSSSGLTASPLRADLNFNWVFLVELIVCGIVTLFFLFYFNRVFATIISYGLRTWTWHKYRVFVDFQSLQISFLGGRIFFRGLRYHGNNETLLIHTGYVTWSYWLRNVREMSIGDAEESGSVRAPSEGTDAERPGQAGRSEEGGIPNPKQLPCRLSVTLDGVEWFVYNRSAAYDAVIASMTQEEQPDAIPKERPRSSNSAGRLRKRTFASETDGRHLSQGSSSDVEKRKASNDEKNSTGSGQGTPRLREFSSQFQNIAPGNEDTNNASPAEAFILRFLPVHIECSKAALVLGNENTKSVLIAKINSASGDIDATSSTGLDDYKQLINFNLQHAVLQMKPNDDYREDQTAAASRIKRDCSEPSGLKPAHVHAHSFFHRQRRRTWHALQDLVPYLRTSVESFSSGRNTPTSSSPDGPGMNGWQGLSRYLDESQQDDNGRWSSIEYAIVSTIVDSPEVSMCFYWDVPGKVGNPASPLHQGLEKQHLNINGEAAPEWGINLVLKGSTAINYGPWADRQRADIQRVFFPFLCKDSQPSKNLLPGQVRIPTQFKLYIEMSAETVLRVPIKEDSKNWKWTKQPDTAGTRSSRSKRTGSRSRRRKSNKGNPGPEVRPFGWLDIKVDANATVAYTMDMLPGLTGFSNSLDLDLPNTEITSSVNHGVLWRSKANRISCDLSNPLQWNTRRTWHFDVVTTELELFILREHVFLLADLVNDWGSGPPPEYLTFIPFHYEVKLRLQDFKIYLNVNDSNIINNPSDFDDNTFVIIFGAALAANIGIPLETYRSHKNEISFNVTANDGGLQLSVPPWNTQATFLNSLEVARLQALQMDGTYQYCATTSTSNTDTLLLSVNGHAPSAHFFGFVIRYFLKVKDNYFGDDIRFRTLEEYQDVLRKKVEPLSDTSDGQPYKKSNDLDVIMSVTADECSVILPSNLYSARNHVRIEIATLAADMRFTNYYMDLDVVLSTLAFSLNGEDDGRKTPTGSSGTQLFIDGVNASGNRLFGLPPTEPTYICNWDFNVGAVSGECTTEFLVRLAAGGRAFAFSFDDDENALPAVIGIVLHDVTFLRASIESVKVWIHVEEAALLLSTSTIALTFNDWAGSHYSSKVNLQLPNLSIGCVDAESASRHRSRDQNPVETHALIQTTVSLAVISKKLNFIKDRQLQQEHIKRHDQRTHRADFLAYHGISADIALEAVDPPAMCIPAMPIPVLHERWETDHDSTKTRASSISSAYKARHSPRRQSSFLSISSSSLKSNGSIVRSQSFVKPDESSRSGSLLTNKEPARDVSSSTRRQSVFSAIVSEPKGVPPSIVFSSSYMAPYFPLEGVVPDTKDLPALPEFSKSREFPDGTKLGLNDIRQDRVNEESTHVSSILELPSGITAVFSPKAADAVATLLEAILPTEPDDILDNLQIDTINHIFDSEKKSNIDGLVIDFTVRTPFVNLRFLNKSDCPERPDQDKHDQYDISLSRLILTSRSETAATQASNAINGRRSSAFHLSLASATLMAKERFSDMNDLQAAVHGVLEDAVVWMASARQTAVNIAFKAVEITTSSSKVEYLASLVHRTNLLATHLTKTYLSLPDQQRNRVQLFTYLVATTGQAAADPLFLTRPSYVLRSAEKHLRTLDSWKIITRLHYIYASLDAVTRQNISVRCSNNAEPVPEHALQQVRDSFAQWRSWDLDDLNGCLVMDKIFGVGNTSAIEEEPQVVEISLRTELIRLVIDPGPKQNEVSLSSISTTVRVAPAVVSEKIPPPAAAPLMGDVLIQILCQDTSINMNWELCELAQDVLKLYQESEVVPESPKTPSSPAKPASSADTKTRQNIQIMIVSEKSSITIDTINIRAILIGQSMNTSFVMADSAGEHARTTANFMIVAAAATSQIKSHSQELALYQLRHPSVYVSYEAEQASDAAINVFKVAANSEELSFQVKQDILGLIQVVDLMIGDEVAQLHRLIESFTASKQSALPEQEALWVSKTSPVNRINVALFLHMYHISLPLLPSLTYTVSGDVARASIAAQIGSEIIFDFDIKEHSHDVQTLSDRNTESMSLLQIPPTNGRIVCHLSKDETELSVFVSVEPVELDAAAVNSILIALNRPEISSVVASIKEEVTLAQSHLEEIFGSGSEPDRIAQPAQSTADHSFIYNAHVTFVGLHVFANAHGIAKLDFNLGCVQIQVGNRSEQGSALFFPEIRVSLHQIMFELSRRTKHGMEPCGNLAFAAFLTATSKRNGGGDESKSFHISSDALEINLFAETASSVIDVMGHLQDKIKNIDFSREKQYFRKLRQPRPRILINEAAVRPASIAPSTVMFSSKYSLELLNINISWLVGGNHNLNHEDHERENLILSLQRVDLSTRKENAARLTIENLQLQMVPGSQDKTQRSLNSALLPEMIFNVGYVSTPDTRRLAFQAAGKSLDLRLTSQFIIPAAEIQRSISSAAAKVRLAAASWSRPAADSATDARRQPFFGKKRMESLLVDVDFAGAVVHLSSKTTAETSPSASHGSRIPHAGRYGQYSHTDAGSNTVLRAPGLAWKVEYKDNGIDDPSLNAEVKVDASSNILYPAVVPLVMEISSTVKAVVSDEDKKASPLPVKVSPPKIMGADEDNILNTDPSAVLGRTRLNLGLRICKQEFSLSCQPIARVAATARFDDIYMTVSTVRTADHGHFFAVSVAFTRLQASVQHVYSREATASFDVDSVILSLMNSKHVSGTSGMSAILKISPMKVIVNAKQLQDFLLFREIWIPLEIRQGSSTPTPMATNLQSQTILVHRYQQVASTGAFPWNAAVSIAELDVQLDLGQGIGRSSFKITDFWISSKKNSDWEQNLCLGFDRVGVDGTGRMSGFVALQDFKLRTSIQWPAREQALNQTPLVQASLSFSKLRIKAAFDYRAFLVADITSFRFLMYNVRNSSHATGDRLVAILDGEAVQMFCTTTTASQALALYQAFEKLIQEKKANYATSLTEIEKYMKRKSTSQQESVPSPSAPPEETDNEGERLGRSPISLHTDVIVTLKAVNVGAFPNTFSDHQVFKLEALNAQARFAVTIDDGKIHSVLGLTLGQLRVGLAGVKHQDLPKSVGDISVEDVVSSATGSRGGTILKVPKVQATMQTWQRPGSTQIDYIFKSSFEGKVEVGWNYSRISYIRGMWATHSKELAQRLGKPLPPSALKITGVPGGDDAVRQEGEQQTITAEVNVPQSKYQYTALEPPIIETPLLQSLGEATPPLEFFGLHRDRLPNLTHQIVIVALLEVAGEVEEAYSKILGSS